MRHTFWVSFKRLAAFTARFCELSNCFSIFSTTAMARSTGPGLFMLAANFLTLALTAGFFDGLAALGLDVIIFSIQYESFLF
ncbi:MAG: hypothetical protein COA99_08915 [Moraxellaceae bacterium]|nr:MAG: hypothetical protein COA99_08915 [Moraxellaceae bacterium]